MGWPPCGGDSFGSEEKQVDYLCSIGASRDAAVRIVRLVREKGSPADCGSSRGLLISDHISKAFVGTLKGAMHPQVVANSADHQYGGMARGRR